METNRRHFLQATAVATAAIAQKLTAQNATVNVPTCPTAVPQPTADSFADGPKAFRQVPVEPLSTGAAPASWKEALAVGAGPCGIAKEFGPTKPHGANVTEFLDDDDPAQTDKSLHNLITEFGKPTNPLTEYYEVKIGEGAIPPPKAVSDASQSNRAIGFLGYGIDKPQWPGPMFQARVGKPMVIRFINDTEDYMSVHLHGGHGPAHSDGHPAFVIPKKKESGLSAHASGYGKNHRDYFYPHTVPTHRPAERKPGEGAPGTQKATDNLDYGESPSTMWYHDHSMDITGPHVALGMAGFFPGFDDHELTLLKNGTLPFCPPKGAPIATLDNIFNAQKRNPLDICIALQDRCFSQAQLNPGDPPANQILYSVKGHNGHLGHYVLVNGKLFPRMTVVPRKYRLRMLDGSNARIYKLALYARIEKADGTAALIDGRPCPLISLRGKLPSATPEWFRIGTDTWLFPQPVRQHKVLLAMAKRADMIVDFETIHNHFVGKAHTEAVAKAKANANAKAIFGRELAADEVISVYLCNLLDQESGRGPKLKLPDGNAQELTAGANGVPTAVPSFQAMNVDGDTNKGELNSPWPLMKFIIEPDLSKHFTDDANLGNRTDFKGLGYNSLSEIPPSAKVTFGTHLREHTPIRADEIVRHREVVFERGNGIWQINGKVVDEFLSNFVPELNTAEEWILENGGGGWWHPIHIHLESHQQIEFLEELGIEEFKLIIGHIIATYEQAAKDERELGSIADANTLDSILATLKSALAPTETRPLDADGNLQRDANDEISLQKLTKASIKRLGEFGDDRAGKLTRPTAPEHLAAFLRLQKTYGGVAELMREFAPDLVFEDHRLWDRIQIQEWDRYKSDTTVLGPNTRVKIRMKFRTFDGPFVFHCHNLEHEDMRMMFTFDPRPTPPGIAAAADSAPSVVAKTEILNDFHLREQPVAYRHPWRFDDTPAHDRGPHADSIAADGTCKKVPDWHDATGIDPTKPPRAHPIWGGWDQHL